MRLAAITLLALLYPAIAFGQIACIPNLQITARILGVQPSPASGSALTDCASGRNYEIGMLLASAAIGVKQARDDAAEAKRLFNSDRPSSIPAGGK